MPRRVKLAKLSVEDLKQEISRRQKALPKLIAKRDCLNCQIAELEGLGGVVTKPAAKRGRKPGRKIARKPVAPKIQKAPRPGSLAAALAEALEEKGKLTIAKLVSTVQAAGYKSKSKDFGNLVSITLSQGKKWFRRIGRGVYKLKS